MEAQLAQSVELVRTGQAPPFQTPQAAAEIVKNDAIQQREQKGMEAINAIAEFDWTHVPPPQLASLLTRIPFKAGGSDPDYYLQPWQAMIFAMRCFELGLSPFSGEVWFNPKVNKVNVTLEGKMKLARKAGMNFGPPHYERVERKGRFVPNTKIEDYGYRCTMSVAIGSKREQAEYTAWLSEWMVPTSPVWKSKPDHMLQLRALEKCISFASGTGASEMMGERDIDPGTGSVPEMPQIEVTNNDVSNEDVTK